MPKTVEKKAVGIPHYRKSDVKWGVSTFVGRLKYRDSGKVKRCDICHEAPATWAHELKKGGQCFLCFGCGDH